MAVHKIKKGLRLPITGAPEQRIDEAPPPRRVALVAPDYIGMKPTMHVRPGDHVRRGQLLFDDKKTADVRFTAPAAGRVVSVDRGARRALQTVVIETSDDERAGNGDTIRFASDTGKHPSELNREQVRALLLESGLWTAIRARPFSGVANPADTPAGIFVTAADSDPLAPSIPAILEGNGDAVERGLAAVSKLTGGTTYVCVAPGTEVQTPSRGDVQVETFEGSHPSGTVGVHIHTLMPVHRGRTAWYLGIQDVIAIGKLFSGGALDPRRVVSLAGPGVTQPRLIRTRVGANLEELVEGQLADGEHRVISGSVFSGRQASGGGLPYLGRYHQQVSVLAEGRERELLGWLTPGADRFSTVNAFLSRLMPGKSFAFTTSTQGSDRAIVTIGMHERVFPMDIMPTFLVKALVMGDVEQAEALGALELDEEDVALLSFVCASKHDYGAHLRSVLTTIQKEG